MANSHRPWSCGYGVPGASGTGGGHVCRRDVVSRRKMAGSSVSSRCGQNRRVFVMNRYGQLAQEHWRRWLPIRYAAIPDPEDFFSTLGQEVQDQVADLSVQLEGPDLPGEGYLEKLGRLNMAKPSAARPSRCAVRSWSSVEQRAYPMSIAAIIGLYRLSYLHRALKRTGLTGR